MRVKGKSALVLGAGKSGLAAVDFLQKKGCAVALYDGSAEEKPVYEELRKKQCQLYPAQVPDLAENLYDFAVISPGIPLTDPCAQALTKQGIPIWSELELASRWISKPIIGITGTNGKTTTTTLIGEILKNAGYRTFVCGNIGVPLLEGVDGDYDYYVVEMSSFQLETIVSMDAYISVYLNLTPDHLNRHGSMEGYLDAKARLAEKQTKDHYTVLNYDDAYMRSLENRTKAKLYFFSAKEHIYTGTSLGEDRRIIYRGDNENGRSLVMRADDILLPGPHNLENAMAAITVARLLNIDTNVISSTLKSFAGVEHRLEKVMTYKGVRYINDSKATNPDSVFKALDSFGDTPIILLAGGRNKGNQFDALGKVIAEKCKALILMGEAAEDMYASAKKAGLEDVVIVDDMSAAVQLGYEKGEKGDIVLLSPANASFDQFNSFEHRGQVFKDIVLKLKRRKTNGRGEEEKKAT